MILLQNVTKEFTAPSGETLRILSDVSFALEPNASYSLVGSSGSGKSTCLALLAGLEKPTRGNVLVDGHALGELDEAGLSHFRARQVGIVFQQFHLLQHFSALQNVVIAAEICGVPNPQVAARQALETVGLGHRLTHRPTHLSGGEQQRVAIARAIVGRPRLLLCDEPTGNLDPQTADRIISLLLDLQKDLKSTLLLVTHDHGIAARMQHSIVLERGSIALSKGTGHSTAATPSNPLPGGFVTRPQSHLVSNPQEETRE